MSLSLYNYPDVFPITQDLSGYVVGSSGTTGVVVGACLQGPVMQRTPITSSRQLITIFGNPPNPNQGAISPFPLYTALAALEEMSLIYFTRVVSDNATYAAVGVGGMGDPNPYGNPYVTGVPYPFDTSIEGRYAFFGTDIQTTVLFYAKNPGAWADNIAISVSNAYSLGSNPDGSGTDSFDLTVSQLSGNSYVILEQWTGLSTYKTNQTTGLSNLDAYGRSRYVEDVLNARSVYINAVLNENAAYPTPASSVTTFTLTTIQDASAGYLNLYFANTSNLRTGMAVTGTNILPGTIVYAISGQQIYLNYPLAADVASGSSITFAGESSIVGLPAVSATLSGGTAGDFLHDSAVIDGWDLYSDHNTISVDVMLNAGLVSSTDFAVQVSMDAIASKRQDCVAILDVPQDVQGLAPSSSIVSWRNQIQNINSSFSALYTGWPLVYDSFNDVHGVAVPVSGFAGQVFARRDKNKGASWYAPAGLTDGLLKSSALPIEGLTIYYDETTQGIIYDAGINYVRMFIGGGYALWGQKTLQFSDSALNRINVRRLIAAMQRSIRGFLMTQVFELNNTYTRQTITNNINQFMAAVKGNNGVYNFLTVCDASNNSAYDIDSNRINVEVRIQPQKSAEFIIFTTTIEKTGTALSSTSQTTTALAASVSQ